MTLSSSLAALDVDAADALFLRDALVLLSPAALDLAAAAAGALLLPPAEDAVEDALIEVLTSASYPLLLLPTLPSFIVYSIAKARDRLLSSSSVCHSAAGCGTTCCACVVFVIATPPSANVGARIVSWGPEALVDLGRGLPRGGRHPRGPHPTLLGLDLPEAFIPQPDKPADEKVLSE